jgi:hypothetical protein
LAVAVVAVGLPLVVVAQAVLKLPLVYRLPLVQPTQLP